MLAEVPVLTVHLVDILFERRIHYSVSSLIILGIVFPSIEKLNKFN